MKVPFGDLSRQYKKYKKEFDSIISGVFKKGSFILGENLRHFEENFTRYLEVNHAIGVANGTDALFLALKAFGIGNGDEVITVSNTAVPTISAIDAAGAKPVFVDIEESTFNIDPLKIEPAITSKTKAIIPVHLYGNPCNMEKIVGIALRYNLKIIEDCAQAHGAEYKGKKVGTFGDYGAFSFYPSKNLGANGDGGMVVTGSDELAEKIRLLRNYGFADRYNSMLRGYNSRLDEIQAALLDFKLTRLNEWNERRYQIADRYISELGELPILIPSVLPEHKHVFHLFVIRVKERQKFLEFMSDNGISIIIHYPVPIHLQPAYEFLNYKRGDFPVTEKVSEEIISLPVYPELEEKEISYIIAKIINYFRK
ncbi:MAG: DegT/DnrJ/EryC1/StrS family aminotransferase [Actinobacteria bacterium]|nr:DegT/DnrJ/EryC1/StrS family aminotransferase [Actinomycetota bacterium]